MVTEEPRAGKPHAGICEGGAFEGGAFEGHLYLASVYIVACKHHTKVRTLTANAASTLASSHKNCS